MINWGKIREEKYSLSNNYVYMNNSTFGAPLVCVNEKINEMCTQFSEGMHGRRLLREVIFKLGDITSNIALTITSDYANDSEKPLIGLVNSVTEGISLIANGIDFSSSDVVLITDHEHDGGETPWLLQTNRYNSKLLKVPLVLDGEGGIDWENALLERFRKKFESENVRVLCIPYITTSTGHILPVKRICALAKSYGVLTVIDAAQAFSVVPIEFDKIGCDFLVANGHKYLCGPIGSGFIAARNTALCALSPTVVDKHNYGSEKRLQHNFVIKPYKKGGPHPYPMIFALEEALYHYSKLGKSNVYHRLRKIGEMLRNGLSSCSENIEIITPMEKEYSCVMTCFRVQGILSTEMDDKIAEYGVHIKRSNEGGVDSLRISPHYYNTQVEYDRLSEAIGKAANIPQKEWPDFRLP